MRREDEVVTARVEEADTGRTDEVAKRERMRRRLVMLSADDSNVGLSGRDS